MFILESNSNDRENSRADIFDLDKFKPKRKSKSILSRKFSIFSGRSASDSDFKSDIITAEVYYQHKLFFAACRNPIEVMSPALYLRHDTRISKVVLEGGRVEAYILPKTISYWPSFFAGKQKFELCREIYFNRIADSNKYRLDETIRLLRQRMDVVSIGLPGIGKSTEINKLLMEFLSHLGDEGWPMEVWYRYDYTMFQYYLNAGEPDVRVVEASTLADVSRLTSEFAGVSDISKLPVLLLEMKEHEVGPMSKIPTYIPLSNREANEKTKDLYKAGARYLLVDPPRCEDIQQMAIFEATHGLNSIFKGNTSEEIAWTVKKRYDIVGAKVREIFQRPQLFDAAVEKLKVEVSSIYAKLSMISVYDMPEGSSNYLAAFVSPNVTIPYLDDNAYRIRFLSEFICLLIAQQCGIENKRRLEAEKFDYLIAESVMCYALKEREDNISSHLDARWDYDKWKFYNNNNGKEITSADSIDRPTFPLCNKSTWYSDMYLYCDVTQLEERTLYRSLVHNAALFDALLVCHANKTVYVFQSSNLRAKNHKFQYPVVKKVMDALRFDEHPDYRLVYVYCSDCSSASEMGIVPDFDGDGVKEDIQKWVEERLTILIARVCYYPNLDAVELPTKIKNEAKIKSDKKYRDTIKLSQSKMHK